MELFGPDDPDIFITHSTPHPMKTKVLLTVAFTLLILPHAHSYPPGGGAWCHGGGWRGWGWNGCYFASPPVPIAPAVYPVPSVWVAPPPMVTAVAPTPPTGINISLFGLNILGINPTVPVAVPVAVPAPASRPNGQ
jgi:hypothetical protein